MPPVVIDNPILNSPYSEPTRHFRDENGQITNAIDEGRRGSSYFLPIAAPKKKAAPSLLDDLPEERAESTHVNEIRRQVRQWRAGNWPDVTPATRTLLEHWHAEDRFRRLFFCQIEALETLIFITEVAKQTKYGQDWIEKYLKEKAAEAGTDLFRVACKMATGSGKTVVMAMLVAWQVLNKRHYPHDNRFTDAFLVVAPGITIRDRLRVLLPSDPNNYYRDLDIVPAELRGDVGTAKIVITNFHAFKQREKGDAGGLTKRVLTANTPGAFTDPHTAAPALWAIRRATGAEFEVSVALAAGTAPWRKALEAVAVALHRQEFGRSPTVNFGRMPVGFRRSSGNNSRLVQGGKRFRGGACEAEQAYHAAGVAPAGPLGGDPQGESWGGHPWSAWQALTADAVLPPAAVTGLYRIRDGAGPGLLYVGEGLVAARLLAHLRKTRHRGDPQGDVFGSAVRPECSWVLAGEWLSHQRLELECDLIGGHLLATGTIPPAQFRG